MTANAKSKTYGDANPALDAVVAARSTATRRLQPGDDGDASLGRRQLPDHGDAGHQPELRRHAGKAALTVSPAVATVTANAKSKTYGEANPALDAVVAGAVNGDML